MDKIKQANRLEDYQPGASRKQIFKALSKVVKSSKPSGNGEASHTGHKMEEKKVAQRVIEVVIEKNLGAFRELERY